MRLRFKSAKNKRSNSRVTSDTLIGLSAKINMPISEQNFRKDSFLLTYKIDLQPLCGAQTTWAGFLYGQKEGRLWASVSPTPALFYDRLSPLIRLSDYS